MKRYLLVLVMLCLALSGLQAQEDDSEKWYWGGDIDGRLFAFTASGQVNDLIAEGFAEKQFMRSSDSSGVALMEVAGEEGFYVLTPDEARQIDLGDIDLKGYLIYAARENDALLWIPTPQPAGINVVFPFMLINLDSGEIVDSGTFSQTLVYNDTAVRYVKVEVEDRQIVSQQIVELTDDGVETVLEIPEEVAAAYPDTNGDHWLFVKRNPAERTESFELVGIDGSSEQLESINRETRWEIRDNWLIRTPLACSEKCEVTRRRVTGDDEQTYTIEGEELFLITMSATENGGLVMWESESDYLILLDAEGEVVNAGLFDPSRGSLRHLTSDDGRYVFTFTEETDGYQLWDVDAGELLMADNDSSFNFLVAVFTENGIMVSEDVRRWKLYRNGEVTDLREDSVYADVLADGRVVFAQFSQEGRGVYVEDLQTGELTLIVPNGRILR